ELLFPVGVKRLKDDCMFFGSRLADGAPAEDAALKAAALHPHLLQFLSLTLNCGPKVAGGEGIQSTHPLGKFGSGEAAFAIQAAEEILRRPLAFLSIAVHAGGNQVAVRIAPRLRAGHHMVEAPHGSREPAQTVKASPALPRVDGLAERLGLHKVDVLKA